MVNKRRWLLIDSTVHDETTKIKNMFAFALRSAIRARSKLCNQYSPVHKRKVNVCLLKDVPLIQGGKCATKIVLTESVYKLSDDDWVLSAKV